MIFPRPSGSTQLVRGYVMRPRTYRLGAKWSGILVVAMAATGCQLFSRQSPPVEQVSAQQAPGGGDCCVPRELRKTVLPSYVIEPPDVLLIEAIHAVPKQPYRLQPFDTVAIQVGGTPAEAPISGMVPIGADGTVNLGPHYGAVFLSGKTVGEAKEIIAKHLAATLVNAEVSISLADSGPGRESPDRTWWPWTARSPWDRTAASPSSV